MNTSVVTSRSKPSARRRNALRSFDREDRDAVVGGAAAGNLAAGARPARIEDAESPPCGLSSDSEMKTPKRLLRSARPGSRPEPLCRITESGRLDPEQERDSVILRVAVGREPGRRLAEGEGERARRADTLLRGSAGRRAWSTCVVVGGVGNVIRKALPRNANRVDAARAAARSPCPARGSRRRRRPVAVDDRATGDRALHRVRPQDVPSSTRTARRVKSVPPTNATSPAIAGARVGGGRFRGSATRSRSVADVDPVQVRRRTDGGATTTMPSANGGRADEAPGREVAAGAGQARGGGVDGRDRRTGLAVHDVVVAVLVAEADQRAAVDLEEVRRAGEVEVVAVGRVRLVGPTA